MCSILQTSIIPIKFYLLKYDVICSEFNFLIRKCLTGLSRFDKTFIKQQGPTHVSPEGVTDGNSNVTEQKQICFMQKINDDISLFI